MQTDIQKKVETLTSTLNMRGLMLATAESCTGGMIAAAVTNRAGSSSVFERGFVTYTNKSKEDLLGVPHEILETKGAVSRECAAAMVQGTLNKSCADLAVCVTGIAGPGGGTPEKPVGLVYIGWGFRDGLGGGLSEVAEHHFSGDRAAVREQSVLAALTHLINSLGVHP